MKKKMKFKLVLFLAVVLLGIVLMGSSVLGACTYKIPIREKYQCDALGSCDYRSLPIADLDTMDVSAGSNSATASAVTVSFEKGTNEDYLIFSTTETACWKDTTANYVSVDAGGNGYGTVSKNTGADIVRAYSYDEATQFYRSCQWKQSTWAGCDGIYYMCPHDYFAGWWPPLWTSLCSYGFPGDVGYIKFNSIGRISLECIDATAVSPCAVDFDNDGFRGNVKAANNGVFAMDCNDGDNSIYPGAPEVCDTVDNDCDGIIDEGYNTGDTCTVGTGACQVTGTKICNADGTGTECSATPGIPGLSEQCDGIDNDCDGLTDEGCDDDNDKYCETGWVMTSAVTGLGGICENEGDSVDIGTDCNDQKDNVYPGAPAVCDFFDNNCDGLIDEGFDQDNDGYKTCENDCDDTNPDINPSAIEKCNGIDENCDGIIDDGCDDDGDNYCELGREMTSVVTGPGGICENEGDNVDIGTDCNDNKNFVYPGADELCDAFDNDCGGINNEDADDDSVPGVLLPEERPCNLHFILSPLIFNVTIPDTINTNDIMGYTWDFGDGTVFGTDFTEEALPVQHTYLSVPEGGKHTVKFRMMDNNFKIYSTDVKIALEFSPEGNACSKDADCETEYCNPEGTCAVPGCPDGWKNIVPKLNYEETDKDCGGDCAIKCDTSKKCKEDSDCKSFNCLNINICGEVEDKCRIGFGACPDGNAIFSMSGTKDAFVAKDIADPDHPFLMCCKDLLSGPTSTTRLVGISALTGAFVENPSLNDYVDAINVEPETGASVTCRHSNNGCLTDEKCIMGVSAETDAVVGECEYYTEKICCLIT